MYVCICKGITESQILDAIRCGVCTRKDMSRCLKVGTACGKCNQDVRNLLQNSAATGGHGSMAVANKVKRETRTITAPGRPSPSVSAAGAPTGTTRADVIRAIHGAESSACLA